MKLLKEGAADYILECIEQQKQIEYSMLYDNIDIAKAVEDAAARKGYN